MKRTLLLLVATAPLLAACGEDVVSESEVEDKTKAELSADKVDCPDDLKAEKDAKMECTATVAGQDIKINVIVTKVDGDTVIWTYEPVE